jgi:type I restriction enzyme R subunit
MVGLRKEPSADQCGQLSLDLDLDPRRKPTRKPRNGRTVASLMAWWRYPRPASEEARAIREGVGFFQALRAALVKSVPGDGKKSSAERELAIQQLVSRAVVSTETVDIMKAAGLESPDISILSDDFLAEVRDSDKKNLAIEALKKLINGNVRSQSKRNVTQSKVFSERLEAAIARYHANAITTAEVLEEFIRLAKDIRAARARGEETGLSDEEIAFYDALAENDSARQVMGEPTLRVIAHELVTVIKGNLSVDWMHRDSARANIRRHVKRLLRKYGYPPDLQDAAVQNVLQQAPPNFVAMHLFNRRSLIVGSLLSIASARAASCTSSRASC